MRWMVILFMLLGCRTTQGGSDTQDAGFVGHTFSTEACMTKHIKEALHINRSRQSHYVNAAPDDVFATHTTLFGNKKPKSIQWHTKKASDRLILLEIFTSLATNTFDWMASTYIEQGIPIVCEDFISMEHTPKLKPRTDQSIPLSDFKKIDIKNSATKALDLLDKQDLNGLTQHLEQLLGKIQSPPQFHCMTRHLVESAIRIAHLAPMHNKLARSKGLTSTLFLSNKLLKGHLEGMDETWELDKMAAIPQSYGIPIICNDVPPIPKYSEFYRR